MNSIGEVSADLSPPAAFNGARILLVGFDKPESQRAAGLFSNRGALSNSIDPRVIALSGDLAAHSAVVLNLGAIQEDCSSTSMACLAAIRAPVTAVGSCAEIERFQAITTRATELIFRPFDDGELLFRVGRCLSRSSVGLARSPQTASESFAVKLPCETDSKPRIVIADDDVSILTLTSGILRSRGYECYEARDGRGALELSRTLLPDLLILDVNMPFINGFDILRALRDDPCTAAMKILMFTGSTGLDDIRRSTALGASGFVCKPFRPFDFLQRVKSFLPGVNTAASNPYDPLTER